MKNSSRSFSNRGFVSLLMAICFAGLAASGIILYIAPPCSIAANTNWSILGMSKVQWASLHQVSALFILILALIHLFVFNWKTFLCYLNRKSDRKNNSELSSAGRKTFSIPKEVIAAIIAGIILYAGAITMIAPFGWLHEGHDTIRDSYRQEIPSGTGEGYMRGDGRGDGRGDEARDGSGRGDGRGEGARDGRGRNR